MILDKYIRVKDIIDEDFINYQKPSMFISTCYCDWKCFKEIGLDSSICQNSKIAKQKDIEISINKLCERYVTNPLTHAIVFGGLEPILQINEVLSFCSLLRNKYHCCDDIVIYTGYYKHEIKNEIIELQNYMNVVIKYGRYRPNHLKHYDEILGVYLSSNTQFAERIS